LGFRVFFLRFEILIKVKIFAILELIFSEIVLKFLSFNDEVMKKMMKELRKKK
jgi:hypothetical protein